MDELEITRLVCFAFMRNSLIKDKNLSFVKSESDYNRLAYKQMQMLVREMQNDEEFCKNAQTAFIDGMCLYLNELISKGGF